MIDEKTQQILREKYNPEGSTLRKAQVRMLDILIEVDKICKKHGIPYWLDSGTLLGAVRHGGFIPWDDDMDIAVLRDDYNRLRDVLIHELPKKYVFSDWKTDKNFFDKCGRVRDLETNVDNPLFSYQEYNGLTLDILIMEPTIPGYKRFVDPLYGPVFRQVHNFGKAIYSSKIKYLFNKGVSFVLYPFLSIIVSFGRYLAKHSKKQVLMSTYSSMFYSTRPIQDTFPLTEIEFEKKSFFAPNNVDNYLKGIYGNYSILPNENERNGHGFNVSFDE